MEFDPRGIALAVLVTCVSGPTLLPSHGESATQPQPGCAEARSIFVAPMGMASTSDGELLIADRGLRAVVVVDPTTGACQLISSDQGGGGNPFNATVAVVGSSHGRATEPNSQESTTATARSSRRRVRSHASEAPPLWSSTSG